MAAIGAVLHVIPAASSIGPIRNRLLTGLSGISSSPNIALTFDDGPDANSTPMFLEKLDQLGWKATFFMLGSMAEKNRSTAQEVVALGHEVALHGYSHKNLLRVSPQATDADIRRGYATLVEITGKQPKYFRPPYGVLNAQAVLTARALQISTILWSGWGRDWRRKATSESVYKDLMKNVRPGATLLLHDSDCTSAPRSYISALGSLDLLKDSLDRRSLAIERLCEHFPAQGPSLSSSK